VTRYVVEEADGEFVIPIAGFVCSQGHRASRLILRGRDSADEAWISGSELGEDLIGRLVGRKARVERAVATRDATLRIAFEGGVSLVNPPADEVEAWEVRGPGYVLVVGVPGGREPAVWDATSEIRVIDPGVDPLPAQVVEMLETWPTLPELTGKFQFRPTARGREAIELHPPDAPPTNRGELVRFVLPGDVPSGAGDPYMRDTN
jgi:hypothetical protein